MVFLVAREDKNYNPQVLFTLFKNIFYDVSLIFKYAPKKAPQFGQTACGKLAKKVQKLFKKTIDKAIFSRYYRGSF